MIFFSSGWKDEEFWWKEKKPLRVDSCQDNLPAVSPYLAVLPIILPRRGGALVSNELDAVMNGDLAMNQLLLWIFYLFLKIWIYNATIPELQPSITSLKPSLKTWHYVFPNLPKTQADQSQLSGTSAKKMTKDCSHELFESMHSGLKLYKIDASTSAKKNLFQWAQEWVSGQANKWA